MPNPPKIPLEVIKTYLDEISKSSSPSTLRRKTASLNRFFDWAVSEKYVADNPLKVNSRHKIISIASSTWIAIALAVVGIILLTVSVSKISESSFFLDKKSTYKTYDTDASSQFSTHFTVSFVTDPISKRELTETDIVEFIVYDSPKSKYPIWEGLATKATLFLGDRTRVVNIPAKLFFENRELFFSVQINGIPTNKRSSFITLNQTPMPYRATSKNRTDSNKFSAGFNSMIEMIENGITKTQAFAANLFKPKIISPIVEN